MSFSAAANVHTSGEDSFKLIPNFCSVRSILSKQSEFIFPTDNMRA